MVWLLARSLALKSAAVAARMVGRGEQEDAIRDAVLLTAAGDDPAPGRKLFLATNAVAPLRPGKDILRQGARRASPSVGMIGLLWSPM